MTENPAMVALNSYAKGAFTLSKYVMMEYPLVEVRMQVLNTLKSNRSGDESLKKVVHTCLSSTKGTAPHILSIQAKLLVTVPCRHYKYLPCLTSLWPDIAMTCTRVRGLNQAPVRQRWRIEGILGSSLPT